MRLLGHLTAGTFLLVSAAALTDHLGNRKLLLQQKPEQSSPNDLHTIISSSPLLSLHKALVDIESISGNELSVGKFLVSTLEAYNFTVTTQKVPEGGNDEKSERWNIYATPNPAKYKSTTISSVPSLNPFRRRKHKPAKSSKPKVIFSSHIDTVPPYIPYSLSRPHTNSKDILIAGRGTVDDKACVAAQIIATLNLLSSPSNSINPADIALLFVVSEETNGSGMKHFSDSDLYSSINSNLKGVIFGEPTEGKLASGHKGISMLHLTARGRAGHSGYPWLFKSANSMIIPALMVLDKLGDLLPEEGGLPRSKEFGNSTVNVGYIAGGVAANVIPAHAEAKVSFRLAGGTPEEIEGIIRRAISSADPKGELEVDIFQGYGPVPLDTDVDGFESMVVNYGTDVINLEVGDGVKRYLYGPGSILVAHGDDEAILASELEQAVVDYENLARHVLGL